MTRKITLKKLTLIGFRKNYDVKFKSGLNFISGPMATGKSSIAEMLSYALGSEKHKAYLEIKKSCKEVELDFLIGEERYKIVRPVFEFNRPAKIFKWNSEHQNFEKEFLLLEIDSPSNPNSLSTFLLNEIGLPNITVANQNFSFRDLFKYSYVKQSIIDSENLLNENSGGSGIKRKPTFEIIFNIYNELLGSLKQELKEKDEKIRYLENKQEGVIDFLKDLNILKIEDYFKEKERLIEKLSERKNELSQIKRTGKYDSNLTMKLEENIEFAKNQILITDNEINEQELYIDKLLLLRNQYSGEKQKIEFILEGAKILNKYDFEVCPSCLNTIQHKEGCNLCGSGLEDLSEVELKVFTSENRRLTKKTNSLISLINKQNFYLEKLKDKKIHLKKELHNFQREIDHLRNEYISPYIEQIEKCNFEIGIINKEMDNLDNSLMILNQLEKIKDKILNERTNRDLLKTQIASTENESISKDTVIKKLSNLFYSILEDFSFPILNDAFINKSNYLPYIRGVKYSELGSGGAVTMSTMAYFLSIALLDTPNKNHLGFLIIDSPRKNLGADSLNDDEFKDEEIFNSIIRSFVKIVDKSNGFENVNNNIQLIIFNNGYPDFLPNEYLIKQFDGKGTNTLPYGLIDDVQ